MEKDLTWEGELEGGRRRREKASEQCKAEWCLAASSPEVPMKHHRDAEQKWGCGGSSGILCLPTMEPEIDQRGTWNGSEKRKEKCSFPPSRIPFFTFKSFCFVVSLLYIANEILQENRSKQVKLIFFSLHIYIHTHNH